MIDDPELRALFKAESEQHLQMLENGLLRLESEPHDASMLEELFRSAHSLKGAARMLGVEGVETLAHHFEEELGAARHGHAVLSPATADRLYHGVDAMRRLAREASDGEPALVDIPRALARLRGEDLPDPLSQEVDAPDDSLASDPDETSLNLDNGASVDTVNIGEHIADTQRRDSDLPDTGLTEIALDEASAAPLPENVLESRHGSAAQERNRNEVTPEPSASAGSALPPVSSQSSSTDALSLPTDEPLVSQRASPAETDESQSLSSPATFKIDTIRVEPHKLDAVMALAGEMVVTTTRVERALDVINDLTALWDEWSRDASAFLSLPAAQPDKTSDHARPVQRDLTARFRERETERLERMGKLLSRLARTSDEGVTQMAGVANALEEAIHSMRLLPFSTIFNLFPRLVRDLSHEQQKEVRLVMEGGAITADKHLLEEIKDPLMHMLRNAIDHGIEPPDERVQHGKPPAATLTMRAYQTATRVGIEISDDGRGLNEEAIRHAAVRKHLRSAAEIAAMSPEEVRMLIFAPGFSTSPLITNVSGRGVGLDVVRANIERLKGTIAVGSTPGRGCTFRLQVPISLATTRVLLVQAAEKTYALPLDFVQEISLVAPEEIFSLQGRPAVRRDNHPVPTARLADLLGLPQPRTAAAAGKNSSEDSGLSCIFVASDTQELGLFVDALLDEQEVILKPFGGLLQRVRNVFGATILNSGEICMVLNPQDLIKSAQKGQVAPAAAPVGERERKKVILIAEDSITTRTQEKRILESAGYEVVTSVDGAEAFNKLGTREFDAVVSDVEMPNMDGLTLAARIRQDVKYKELPIILVTSLATDQDRRRGIEVGANAYITKGAFEQTVLLDTLKRLV